MADIAKLLAPSARHILRRQRIVSALERRLERGSVWIAAPAGYGKSSAVADYVAAAPQPHLWYRIDPGDDDIASFFHYLGRALPPASDATRLPRFGSEYADQPLEFARRFLRSFFARLSPGTLLVFDDLHEAASREFCALLPLLVRETPSPGRCIFISRTLPPRTASDPLIRGELSILDQGLLQFSDEEARALLRQRLGDAAATTDVTPVRGWAAGLVLLAGRDDGAATPSGGSRDFLFDTLAQQFLDTLSEPDLQMLLIISLLPEVTPGLAVELTGGEEARDLVRRLHDRQLLIGMGGKREAVYRLHDLLRDLLAHRFSEAFPPAQQVALRVRAAEILLTAGRSDEAVELAIAAGDWDLVTRLIEALAPRLLAEGRRATLTNWCSRIPEDRLGGWLCYWLGVAAIPDDQVAERWLARAWSQFESAGNERGLCLAAARAVLVKTDSWRTHQGLAVWTNRLLGRLDRIPADLAPEEELLVLVGMLHAADFAEVLDLSVGGAIAARIVARLNERDSVGEPDLKLLASAAVVEHAGSNAKAELFEQAVDAVGRDLGDADVSPWALGLWLVSFGSVSGRYFSYARRGFPYATAEAALREAVDIGFRETLRPVEFGALYHLQLQLKLRNRLDEFGVLVERLCQIVDSRNTTQVAVAADCRAALHTLSGDLAAAYQDCDRFMSAIEAADEPPIERWPHFITRFQLLVADRKAEEAAGWLGGLLDLFDGALQDRTRCCILLAEALAAKWGGALDHAGRLQAAMTQLRAAGWTSIFANLPTLLAETMADALQKGCEPEFARRLIAERGLLPPPNRPPEWPWPVRIHVLGQFGVEVDGVPLRQGPKAPARTLDLLRALALAPDHVLPITELHDGLWPDADGDQAKAACDQALHRLRKLLGRPDVVVQRDGKARLASELCWVDLDEWEPRLASRDPSAARQALDTFPGPVLADEDAHPLWTRSANRVRRAYVALARSLAREAPTEVDAIRDRLLQHYPDAPPILA